MTRHIIALIACACGLSSCASIFCGAKKNVTFEANIPAAETLTIDGYKYYDVEFPFTAKVPRGFYQTVVVGTQAGYKKATVTITKTFNPVSIINLTNILGWGIDAATGAMMQPEYNLYTLEFRSDAADDTLQPQSEKPMVEIREIELE